jgi:RNA polymerase sigma factor (sigma-70 family)
MDRKSRIFENHLVTWARSGDKKAFAQLASLRGPRLLAHATRLLGDREEALDVVQDAWVDIARGLRGLRDPEAFLVWALRIVSRRAAKQIRHKQTERSAHRTLALSEDPPLGDVPEKALQYRDVRRAIASLPAEQSATIALFYLEDLSVAEVATALDIPPGTVKTRLMTC